MTTPRALLPLFLLAACDGGATSTAPSAALATPPTVVVSAAPTASASSSSPSAPPPTPPGNAELDPVPGIGEPPSEDAWQKAPEARVTDAASVECTTRVSGSWFQAACGSEKLPAFAAAPVRGAHRGQTRAEGGQGRITFTTPFVEGTDLRVRFDFATERRFLFLRWRQGEPRPATLGAFEKGK